MKLTLTEFALKRPITVTMMVVSVIALGIIAWYRTPLKFMPEMDFPFVFCFIPYAGATPEQVEKEVAIPAEGEFRTISHLNRIVTYSTSNGCRVIMRFAWDANMGVATSDVRDRIERLKLVLPDEIDRMIVQRFNSGSLPVFAFGIFRTGDEEEFAHTVRTVLRPRLMRLPGVADVEILSSKPESEIMIEFDQNALRRSNLPIYNVIAQLQTASLNLSAGELIDGNTKYYVRTMSELRNPEELAELVVGPNALRLKDVADVGYSTREYDQHYDIDGQGGAICLIRKESEANTVATCKAILDAIERAKQDSLFEDANFFTFFDQSALILTALSNLKAAGKYGGCMALVVLFLFLRRFRPTLLVALAIPSSLVCALVFIFLSGMTLNVVTMVSLIVAIGMLVDNSIVVVENIYRYRHMGYSPYEASLRGASEVGLAITAATCTTVVVFIPTVYMKSGQMSNYTREFAAPMILSLSASLLIALTVIPLATSRMKDRQHLRSYAVYLHILGKIKRVLGPRISGLLSHFNRQHVLHAIIHSYSYLLGAALRQRLASLALVIALLVITQLTAFRHVGAQEMPTLDFRQVNIELDLEQNFDIEMAAERIAMLQGVINGLRDELGVKSVFTHYDRDWGAIECYLLEVDDMPPGQLPPYPTDKVLDILDAKLPERIPGGEIEVLIPENDDEANSREVSIRFRGNETQKLNELAEQFKELMKHLPYLSDTRFGTKPPKEEMSLRIDEPVAERSQISPWMVARTVDVALRGARLPYMKHGGREVPVWAQFREEDRKSRDNLDNVAVTGATGNLIPLNQLVEYSKTKSPEEVRRVNGKNEVRLYATVSTKNYTKVQRQLRELIDYFELPPGYSIELGDTFERINENIENFVVSLALAVILIYLVMSALFESFLFPLSIMTTVPLSFVGVYWLMHLTNTSLDAISFIGCILMVGIIVNNGIVIVDHINLLRKRGMGRYEAILQSGRDRFRPVMMTAITTILGCLPLAVGSEYGSRVTFMSLGRALIGGLTVGTMLTLFIVPLFYSFIDDFQHWFLAFCANLAGVGRKKAPEAEAPVVK
ncbi:MAG TPA: efflux RND transporter permease subunit [Candidatus Hydrogenedentes bacterium]|nr:efflux RND transporter permease subunit [Candidatus Hydrogenedentota bacterium]